MAQAILITGGNLGDTAATLASAREKIVANVGNILRLSSVMESEAWGFDSADRFLNQVLVVETELGPLELLESLQEIEREMGREVKRQNWRDEKPQYTSRNIDIDILYYDDIIFTHERLCIPHPKIAERAFVLRPLCEVMGGHRDPRLGKTACQMLVELENKL